MRLPSMITLLPTLLLCMTTMSLASEGEKVFTVFGTTGYGIPLGGYFVGNSSTDPTERINRYLNIGKGLKIEAGALYRMMPNVDALFSTAFSAGLPRTTVDSIADGGMSKTTYHYANLGFKLMAVPRFTALELIDIYIGSGLGLFFAFSSYDSTSSGTTAPPGIREELEVKESYYPTLAWTSVIGAEYPLSKTILLTADISFDAMSFTMKQQITTDLITGITEKPINYSRNQTDRYAPISMPASNLAFRIGVRIPLF